MNSPNSQYRGELPSDFEQSLEKSLIASQSTSQRLSIMNVLNQSFTIWMLSTIAVGLFGYSFTKYSDCQSAVRAHIDKSISIQAELDGRILLLRRLASVPTTPIAKWVEKMDPDKGSYILEYKGRSVGDLNNQMNLQIQRASELGIVIADSYYQNQVLVLDFIDQCVGWAALQAKNKDTDNLMSVPSTAEPCKGDDSVANAMEYVSRLLDTGMKNARQFSVEATPSCLSAPFKL